MHYIIINQIWAGAELVLVVVEKFSPRIRPMISRVPASTMGCLGSGCICREVVAVSRGRSF